MAYQSDVTWPITLSLTEALRGCSQVVNFPRREVPCRACLGSGQRENADCDQCDGTGLSEIIKRIPVDLPMLPGDLARVRVAGAGEYDEETGGFGDLSLICHVMPQDGLDLVDGQLHATISVSPERQVQGGQFEVPLPGAALTVQLDAPLSDGEIYEFDLVASGAQQERTLIVEISAAEAVNDLPSAHADSDEISRLHAEARNAEKNRDFERARDAYCRLAELDARSRTLRKCGWMHLRLDDLDAAARYMRQAVERDWTDAEAHYYKGAVHHKRGEALLAVAEMEYASSFGLDVKQLQHVRQQSLQQVFQPAEEVPDAARGQYANMLEAAINHYYGAAAAACRELLRSYQTARMYYQHGAANWLLSIDGEEDRLAEAYLGLRAAAAMAPDAEEFAHSLSGLERALANAGTPASRVRIAGHLLRQGEAGAALGHTAVAREEALDGALRNDREAASLNEAAEAALIACAGLTDGLQPAHRVWEEAVGTTLGICSRLDGIIEGLTSGPEMPPRRQATAASKEAAGLGRDILLPLCGRLQDHLEQNRRHLPREFHAWFEGIIEDAARLKQRLRQTARMAMTSGSSEIGISDQIETLRDLHQAVASFHNRLQRQHKRLDLSLCDAWRASSHLLHIRVMVSQHAGRDDHLERCRHLTRAVRLEQLARSMRPEAERTVEQRRATCRLLDDFQEAAQAAAGTGAFARAEFFQNTIDSLRGDLVPDKPLAESPEELLQDKTVELFDWACEVLFDGTTAFPQEFLVDARQGSYAVTNYRLAHRQSDATTFVSLPLTSIQRYEVRASGATTRVVTLTLADGRRLSFNNVPVEDVLPRERMSWLIAAEMWKTLREAELEALEANRPAPTSQLPAEATRDRRRLLGDTRQQALEDGGETVVCPQCGRYNFPRDRFCRDCGAQLRDPEQQALSSEDRSALPDGERAQEDGDDSALP